MKRAAIYARVSTMEQLNRGTIQTQIEVDKDYCEGQGWTIAGVYLDDGVSGTLPFDERSEEGGKRLLRDAERKAFDVVVSYKLDRMYRSVSGAFSIIEWLDQHGIGYASATQPFDTSSAFGRALLGFFAIVAALERDMILERTAEGKQRVAREGRWPGGPPPFGFQLERHRLVPNWELLPCGYSEAGIIQLIFRLAADEKLSYQGICDRLTALGVPSPAYCRPLRNAKRTPALHWRASTLANWFRGTTYIGQVPYADGVLPVEPLIDSTTYQLARQHAEQRRILCGRGSSTRTYLLKNLIKCGSCGHSFHGSMRRYGRPRHDGRWHYACTGKRHHAMLNGRMAPRCQVPEVDGADLEQAIWKHLLSVTRRREATIQEIVKSGQEIRQNAAQQLAELDQLHTNRQAKENERHRLTTGWRQGRLTDDEYDQQKSELLAEEQVIDRQIEKARERWQQAQQTEQRTRRAIAALDVLEKLTQGEPTPQQRREALELAVSRIIITRNSDGTPHIDVEILLDQPANIDVAGSSASAYKRPWGISLYCQFDLAA